MTELRAAVKLIPLIMRRVEVDEFVLIDPKINLIRKPTGEDNWTFPISAPTSPDSEDTPSESPGVSAVLGDVRLVNGNILFDDQQNKERHELSDLNITLALPSMSKTLRLDGSGALDGDAFEIKTTLKTPRKLLDGKPSALDGRISTDLFTASLKGDVTKTDVFNLNVLADAKIDNVPAFAGKYGVVAPAMAVLNKVSFSTRVTGHPGDLKFSDLSFRHDSDLLKVNFNGAAALTDGLNFDGVFELNAPKLRDLAAATGTTLPAGDAYKAFKLDGQAKGNLTKVVLKNASIRFDDIRGTGNLALNLSGVPHLSGDLSTNVINTTPYASASGATSSTNTKQAANAWQTEPLDLTPLNAANADLSLTAEGIRFQDIEIGKSVVKVTLNNGRLEANVSETSLYGGAGDALIVANARGATPSVRLKANLDTLNIGPFLGAAANFTHLEGAGGFEVDVLGTGQSIDAIMKSLSGQGQFKFNNGAIKGVNVAQLLRSAEQALTTGAIPDALSPQEATDFTDFTGHFSIQNGVASTNDLNLLNPIVQIPGKGQLNLGERTLSLSMFPRSGDKAIGINGYAPPLRVSGAWTNLNVGLDTDWLQEQLTNELQNELTDVIADELGVEADGLGGIISGEASGEDILRGVLGQDGNRNKDKEEDAQPTPDASEATSDASANDASTSAEEAAPEDEEKTVEEELEDALKSIFD